MADIELTGSPIRLTDPHQPADADGAELDIDVAAALIGWLATDDGAVTAGRCGEVDIVHVHVPDDVTLTIDSRPVDRPDLYIAAAIRHALIAQLARHA